MSFILQSNSKLEGNVRALVVMMRSGIVRDHWLMGLNEMKRYRYCSKVTKGVLLLMSIERKSGEMENVC